MDQKTVEEMAEQFDVVRFSDRGDFFETRSYVFQTYRNVFVEENYEIRFFRRYYTSFEPASYEPVNEISSISWSSHPCQFNCRLF